MPMTPDYRESKRQNVEPERFSISKEMDSRRHMWKKVLYWIVERPGWCKKLQYMKFLGSEVTLFEIWFICSSSGLTSSGSLTTSILYSPVSWSSYPSIKISKKAHIVAFSLNSLLISTAQNKLWAFGSFGFGKATRSTVTWPIIPYSYKTFEIDSHRV